MDTIPQIISRAEAKASGLTRYFTGVPCKHGHVDERFTGDRTCMSCSREKAQRRYAESPEAKRESSRLWREENTEASREYARRWQAENREASREMARRWYAENPEKARENNRLWREENPEACRANTRKRKAKVACGASGKEVQAWARAQTKVCLYCQTDCEHDYHIDHVTPLALGGEHEIHNLAIACPSCNLKKHATPAWQFMERLSSTSASPAP